MGLWFEASCGESIYSTESTNAVNQGFSWKKRGACVPVNYAIPVHEGFIPKEDCGGMRGVSVSGSTQSSSENLRVVHDTHLPLIFQFQSITCCLSYVSNISTLCGPAPSLMGPQPHQVLSCSGTCILLESLLLEGLVSSHCSGLNFNVSYLKDFPRLCYLK